MDSSQLGGGGRGRWRRGRGDPPASASAPRWPGELAHGQQPPGLGRGPGEEGEVWEDSGPRGGPCIPGTGRHSPRDSSGPDPEREAETVPAQQHVAQPDPALAPERASAPDPALAQLRPLVIGTPIYEFEAKPSSWSVGAVFRPDTIVDGWATEHFVLRGASVRGYSHRWEGLPRQDDLAVAVHPDTGAVLVAVADGVASARLSHIGATWACHTAIGWLSDVLNDGTAVDDVDWSGLLTQAALALVQYTNEQLGGGPDGREAGLDLATTLVAGAVVPRGEGRATAFLVRAGDSGAWLLRDGAFSAMPGGKASGIGEIAESAVEYPLPSLSPSPPRPYVLELGTSDVLLIGTDGFGDPLGAGTGEVGRAFARHLASPPPPLAFARLLDFSRELYDDDRTLIAVWPQHLR